MAPGINLIPGNKTLCLVFILLWTALANSGETSDRIEIVSGGKSAYSIVIPDQADQDRISPAANLLQKTIQESTGVKLPIVKESELPKGTPGIYLGKSNAARAAGLPLDKVKDWDYLNKTIGKDIFLVGDDAVYDLKKTDGKPAIEHLGTLKAATDFLDEQAGVRFLLPGEFGTQVPKVDRLTVDAGMNKYWQPHFVFVMGAPSTLRLMNDPKWPWRADNYAVANNLLSRNPVFRSFGAHSYPYAVPEQVYAKTHPEYFALVGDTRTPRGNHLCISNPEVQELILKTMEKGLDEGYQWVELGQTDGYIPCECKECAAINPDPGERTWIVHRKLAEEMLKRRPGKKVVILAYDRTQKTPKSFNTFPNNVIIEMSSYYPEDFAAWAPFHVDKMVYTYNWGSYHREGMSPKRTPRVVVDQIRLFAKNGVRGIAVDGGFNRVGSQGWGLEAPVYYAYGKALGDPQRDPDALFREYVDAAFGPAAAPMRAFFTAMYDRLELYSRVPAGMTGFATPEDFFCYFFPPKLLNDMATSLERAKAVANAESLRARLEQVEMEFNYVRRHAAVFHFYRAYRMDPGWEAFDLLADKVQKRMEYIDWLYPGGQLRQVKGLPGPYVALEKPLLEAGGRSIPAPLNWDFKLLREKKMLPGVGLKRVECPRIDGIALDGKLDDSGWQAAKFEELNEIGMGALKNASRFKVAYDDKYLYIGVVCELDNLACIDKLQPAGRDGPASGQECVEIMLDAFGTRERYCHFIFNPVPNSTLDRRVGYIDDPLHPLFDKPDSSWNGVWDYVATVDREKKNWTAEVRIPFSTLNAPPPGPGMVWTMNIGRTEWPESAGSKKGAPIYSLWSPNLESRSFHDRATFGEVIFK